MIRKTTRNKAVVLIDSGAYSAWKGGKEIDIHKYCDFLLANQSWIGPYFNLDVIDKSDPEAGAAVSYENWRIMLRAGLKPIPVYHIGESDRWLQRMLDAGCDYLAIGGTVGQPIPEVMKWYKDAWKQLVNSEGFPVVRVHALGNGKFSSLRMFPWASGDSTSWLYTAQRTARMTLDGKRNVSSRKDKLHSSSAQDVDSLVELDLQVFNDALNKFRIKREAFEERGRVSAIMRTWITAVYYMEVQEQIRALEPIRYGSGGFFSKGASRNMPAAKMDPFRLYLVGGTNNIAYIIMAALGHPYVLASYFYIKHGSTTTHAVSVPLDLYARDPKQALANTPQWESYREILERYTY